jgi:hypothetical protein
LSECAGIDKELDTEEENGALGKGAWNANNCVEITTKDEETGYNHVGDFHDDLGY